MLANDLNSPLDPADDLTLTPDAEQALCANIRALEEELLRHLRALDAAPTLHDDPARDRAALADAVRRLSGHSDGVRTVRRLQRSIDRLTWRLALSGMDQVRHQLRKRSYQRVSREELRQAGMMGLFQAARRFEAARGIRFSTYCRYWVRDAMGEVVGRLEYAARLPGKARRQLRSDHSDLSARQARALARVRHAVDLDAPAGDDSDQRKGDLLASDAGRWNPELQVEKRRRMERLGHALAESDLADRDRHILVQRFGLGGNERRTNRDIGEELGVSGERVRQLQKRAVAKLRRALQA